MSLSSSLTGMSFSGISSGIDTESIISRLLLLDQAPIQRLQARQAELTQRLGLMSSFRAHMGSLSTAIAALGTPSAFQSMTATLGDSAIASASLGSSATAGSYALEVLSLAQSHKASSAGQASGTEALNLKGEVVLNGRTIQINEDDSLTAIAAKINATNAGVSANVIDGGAGNVFLSLTSKTSGADGAIRMADVSGAVLGTLGVLDANETLESQSYGFTTKTGAISDLLGAQDLDAGTFTLNGVDIAFDPATGSIEDLAAAINGSGSGASASIVTDASGKFRLQLSGVTSHADPDGLLHAVGLVQNGFANELVAAQNASFKVDGILLSSATNTATAIPGVTLTLKKVGSTTLEIAQDMEGIKSKLTEFVEKFNDLIAFVDANGSFDKESLETGALFGDTVVGGIEASLTNILYTQLKGNEGLFSSLSEVGISLNSDGKLEIDEIRLDAVLASDMTGLTSIFRSTGTTTVKALEYVGGTSNTKPSGEAGYQVFVTALAQKQISQAADAQAGPLAQAEVLTFTGPAFSGGSYEITLDTGMTQEQIIDRINGDSKLKGVLTASSDGGKLALTGKSYGTAAAYGVMSNVASGGSGWGSGTVVQAATDIAGTINGEDAVGAGQTLTGKAGNANTDGLQVKYTGVATGVIGTVTYSKGISDRVTGFIADVTESTNGLLTTNDKAIQDQIDGIADQISFRGDRIAAKRLVLQARFNRMEQIIAELQAQQARIAQFGQ